MRALFSSAALCLVVGCFESAEQPGQCSTDTPRACTCDDGGPGWEHCYLESPAVWGPCVCNMQPVASAGGDVTVSYKTTVVLEGSSVDSDGPQQIYAWTVDSVPPGSAAMLDDPSIAQPQFLADVVGQYRFTLTVGDGFKTSAPASVTVTARNDSPIAVVNSGTKMFTGAHFTLDGSASTDPNGDPITYQWTVTSAPSGSTAVPASPTSATSDFVPDVIGLYKLALIVDDGSSSSAAAVVTLDAYFPFTMISGFVRDAEYSKALDRVVMIVPTDKLYTFDPVTHAVQSLTLPNNPSALTITPDGLSAIVGYSGFISLVDLQTLTITRTITVPGGVTGFAAFDVVAPGNGYAYGFPTLASRAIQNVPLNGIDPVVAGTDNTFEYYAKLVPGTLTIYATANGGTLTGIWRFDIQSSLAKLTRAVSSDTCDNLWVSDDGLHIFTRCGDIYSISNTAASDMLLEGSLTGESYTQYLTQSSSAGKLVAIPANNINNSLADTTARFYNYPSLALDRVMNLPKLLIGGTIYDGHGTFAFIRADNQTVTIIEVSNTSGGGSYGIGTFPL